MGKVIDFGDSSRLVLPHHGLALNRVGDRWQKERFSVAQFGSKLIAQKLPLPIEILAAGWVDGEEVAILQDWFRGTTRPNTPSHIGLFTTTPADTGSGGVEVTGGSYARQALARNGTNWAAASGTAPVTIASAVAVTFPEATAGWGTVTAWGYFTAITSGTLLFFAALTASKAVDSGDTANFAIGGLVAKLGDPGDSY